MFDPTDDDDEASWQAYSEERDKAEANRRDYDGLTEDEIAEEEEAEEEREKAAIKAHKFAAETVPVFKAELVDRLALLEETVAQFEDALRAYQKSIKPTRRKAEVIVDKLTDDNQEPLAKIFRPIIYVLESEDFLVKESDVADVFPVLKEFVKSIKSARKQLSKMNR